MKFNTKSIGIGITLFLILNGATDWYGYERGSPPISGWLNLWDKYGFIIIKSLLILIPGFVTGYLCKSNAITHGIVVSVIGTLVVALIPTVLVFNFSPYHDFAFYAFMQYGIYCIIMSIVGEYFYTKHSNKRLIPDNSSASAE